VNVVGAKLESGFARGHMRRSYEVPGFSITRYPITVRQYRECVEKGACAPPGSNARTCRTNDGRGLLDGPTFEREGDLPITCVTMEQAAGYCQWVGGALPTAQEWMLAARGPEVKRHAWGNDDATCKRHPEATEDCAPEGKIAAHPESASPAGVEDVLLSRAELARASADADFPACAPPRQGCSFYGIEPGAIDSVEPVGAAGDPTNEASTPAAFRCVWRKEAR
jgi:hypothetical protein